MNIEIFSHAPFEPPIAHNSNKKNHRYVFCEQPLNSRFRGSLYLVTKTMRSTAALSYVSSTKNRLEILLKLCD